MNNCFVNFISFVTNLKKILDFLIVTCLVSLSVQETYVSVAAVLKTGLTSFVWKLIFVWIIIFISCSLKSDSGR